jgi:hypothetical protein
MIFGENENHGISAEQSGGAHGFYTDGAIHRKLIFLLHDAAEKTLNV